MTALNSKEISRQALIIEAQSPQEILAWAVVTFYPDLVASSSFQTQSVPLLHMISQIKPALCIYAEKARIPRRLRR